jgi:hypothetical protein
MVSRNTVKWILTLSLLVMSCQGFASVSPTPAPVISSPTAPEPTRPPETPTPTPDYALALRNAQYQLGTTDSLRVVQLTDGKFEQGEPGGVDYISVIVTDFVALGDLNGDGRNEVAALIGENFGGTGVFVFLAVYADVNGTLTFLTSTIVDDRPLINALSIGNNEIFLGVTVHGFEDPGCCPTLRTTRHYRLSHGNQLDMSDYTTFTPDDRPRTITIESPVSGSETFNSVLLKGSVAIAPFENNLVYRIYDLGGVLLSEGSITVNAPDLGAPGTFEQMIPLGSFLSGTTIRIRVQDISAADGALFAMDSVELVVK